jgi:hypothetical protein
MAACTTHSDRPEKERCRALVEFKATIHDRNTTYAVHPGNAIMDCAIYYIVGLQHKRRTPDTAVGSGRPWLPVCGPAFGCTHRK